MRILIWAGLCSLLFTFALAWTKEDHEIFDLVSAIEASEGKGTTFYSFLGVAPSATTQEISRAYRRRSVMMHPDKNKGRKDAHERFARLGVIAQIMRNSEGRERYDFFFKNGVPRWRGTGYYYSRYRPGLGSVAVFLVILTSGVHYAIQRINYRNDLARIERFVSEARAAAWGPRMMPIEGKRKVRINMGGRPYLDDEGNVVGGKLLDMVVQGNDVFIQEPDGSLLPLDASATSPPSWKRTWFIAFVSSFIKRKNSESEGATADANGDGEASDALEAVPGNKKQRKAAKKASKRREGAEDTSESDALSSGAVTPVGGAGTGSGLSGRLGMQPTTMAGGRRRKGVPRKVPDRKVKEEDVDGDGPGQL